MPNKLISPNAFNGVLLEDQHLILGVLAVDPSVPQETREAAQAERDTLPPSPAGELKLARALERMPKG